MSRTQTKTIDIITFLYPHNDAITLSYGYTITYVHSVSYNNTITHLYCYIIKFLHIYKCYTFTSSNIYFIKYLNFHSLFYFHFHFFTYSRSICPRTCFIFPQNVPCRIQSK